jgi:hypothetical protein
MLNLQASSVAPLGLPAETVGLTAHQGLSVLDQSPIFSNAVHDYIGNLRHYHIAGHVTEEVVVRAAPEHDQLWRYGTP